MIACGALRQFITTFVFFFAGMALGTLTKGPPGVLFPLGTVVIFLLGKKRLRVLLEPGFWWGWVVFVIIVLPWILLYFTRISLSTFLARFSVEAILTRPEPFYYYLVQFWPRFFPWALFLPAAILFLLRKNPDFRNAKLFLLCWLGVILVVIFPMHNKSYRYLLPAFPVFSIILGAAWKEAYLGKEARKDGLVRWWEASTRICLTIFAVSLVVGPFFTWWYTRSLSSTLASAFVLIVGCLFWAYTHYKWRSNAKTVLIGLLAILIWETYFFFISEKDEKHSPGIQMAATITSRINKDNLRTFDFHKSIYLDFYLDTVIPELKNPSEVVSFLTEMGECRACLMSESGYKQISPLLPPKKFEVQHIPYRKRVYFLVIGRGENQFATYLLSLKPHETI